jgi:hypothetical protein
MAMAKDTNNEHQQLVHPHLTHQQFTKSTNYFESAL